MVNLDVRTIFAGFKKLTLNPMQSTALTTPPFFFCCKILHCCETLGKISCKFNDFLEKEIINFLKAQDNYKKSSDFYTDQCPANGPPFQAIIVIPVDLALD